MNSARTAVYVDKPWLHDLAELLTERAGPEIAWSFASELAPDEAAEALAAATVFVGSHLSSETIRLAPNLRLVQTTGAGLDKVAIDALPRHVTVASNHHHERAIAEYVMASMVVLSRRMLEAHQELRQGRWLLRGSQQVEALPRRLDEQSVLLLGYGRIGREISSLAQALRMRVIAVNRSGMGRRDRSVDVFGTPDELPQLVPEADHVVVLLPLTEETRGSVDDGILASMPSSAYLINVSRGPVVVEQDLFDALRNRTIAGAAIDVWYRYPTDGEACSPSDLPFEELDNVLMTPHMSGITYQTYEERARHIADNVRRFHRGQQPEPVIDRS